MWLRKTTPRRARLLTQATATRILGISKTLMVHTTARTASTVPSAQWTRTAAKTHERRMEITDGRHLIRHLNLPLSLNGNKNCTRRPTLAAQAQRLNTSAKRLPVSSRSVRRRSRRRSRKRRRVNCAPLARHLARKALSWGCSVKSRAVIPSNHDKRRKREV